VPISFQLGNFGTLYKFVGNTVLADTVALLEEDGINLTEKGKAYAAGYFEGSLEVEIIRVRFDQ
jgi:hypothetical protein